MNVVFHVRGAHLRFGTDSPAATIARLASLSRGQVKRTREFVVFDVISRNQEHRTRALAKRVIIIRKHKGTPYPGMLDYTRPCCMARRCASAWARTLAKPAGLVMRADWPASE